MRWGHCLGIGILAQPLVLPLPFSGESLVLFHKLAWESDPRSLLSSSSRKPLGNKKDGPVVGRVWVKYSLCPCILGVSTSPARSAALAQSQNSSSSLRISSVLRGVVIRVSLKLIRLETSFITPPKNLLSLGKWLLLYSGSSQKSETSQRPLLSPETPPCPSISLSR